VRTGELPSGFFPITQVGVLDRQWSDLSLSAHCQGAGEGCLRI